MYIYTNICTCVCVCVCSCMYVRARVRGYGATAALSKCVCVWVRRFDDGCVRARRGHARALYARAQTSVRAREKDRVTNNNKTGLSSISRQPPTMSTWYFFFPVNIFRRVISNRSSHSSRSIVCYTTIKKYLIRLLSLIIIIVICSIRFKMYDDYCGGFHIFFDWVGDRRQRSVRAITIIST